MPKPAIVDVVVAEWPIRLGQFLKLAELAYDGSHGKILLRDGQVLVNGEPKTRRGAQLHLGDVVTVGETNAVRSRPPADNGNMTRV